MNVSILGSGLYPFGRHEGVGPIEMGVAAANDALSDAGLGWNDIQFACAGSLEVLQPDTMIKHMGLTGIPFTTLYNGCATGGNLLLTAA
ncbi:MAG: thiolase family protein, partial [bacterium]